MPRSGSSTTQSVLPFSAVAASAAVPADDEVFHSMGEAAEAVDMKQLAADGIAGAELAGAELAGAAELEAEGGGRELEPRSQPDPRETPPKRRPPQKQQRDVVDLTDDLDLGLSPSGSRVDTLTGGSFSPVEPEPEPKPTVLPETPTPPTRKTNWAKLTVVELRTLLGCFGLPTDGNKAALVSRLGEHTGGEIADGGTPPRAAGGGGGAEGVTTPPRTAERKATAAAKKQAREAEEAAAWARRARRPQVCSFDIETTIPRFKGDGCHLLEFGALVVDANSLVEDPRLSYETLVRPEDLKTISKRSVACNHITQDMVKNAPSFRQVAHRVFDVLDGRVWLGHNIMRFDIPQLAHAFEAAGLAAPTPAGIIDTLPLLKEHFGKRAGDMKMASLGVYFNQGEEEHRALSDARMTMNVMRGAGAVLFLEQVCPGPMDCGDAADGAAESLVDVAGMIVGGDEASAAAGAAAGAATGADAAADDTSGVSDMADEEESLSQSMAVASLEGEPEQEAHAGDAAVVAPPAAAAVAPPAEAEGGGLTDAQREQVERNRARALELRAAKNAERQRQQQAASGS